MKTVAIVGGGISGLAAAEQIGAKARERGVSVRTIVLEADRIAGGKIRTEKIDGFVVESGPHGFLDKEPAMRRTIDRLGLSGSVVTADRASAKRFVIRHGRLTELPMSPPRFATSKVLSFGAKLRMLGEPFAGRASGEESVHGFAARRLGVEAADVLVDAMVTGIYGGDPKRLSVGSAFPKLAELERAHGGLFRGQIAVARARKRRGEGVGPVGGPAGELQSFKDGLGTLIEALTRQTELRLGAEVRKITCEAGRFQVALADGPLQADAVVVTTPAYDMAKLLDGLSALEAIPYAPVAVVVQGFRPEDLDRRLEGFGFLAPELEGRLILGSIFASTVFGIHAPSGLVMLRTLVGGRRHPERAEGSDAEVVGRVRAELAALIGLRDRAPIFERIFRWPRGIPQYELGHAERVLAANALEKKTPGLWLGGNALRGVALVQCVAEAERIGGEVVEFLARA